jgi:hypothetical protein
MLNLFKKKAPKIDCVACKEMLKVHIDNQNKLANEISKAGLELLKSAYDNKIESLKRLHFIEVSNLLREIAMLQRVVYTKGHS